VGELAPDVGHSPEGLSFSYNQNRHKHSNVGIQIEQARAGPKLNLQRIIDSFNRLGEQGWEAVAAIVGSRGQVFVLFKRQVGEKAL